MHFFYDLSPGSDTHYFHLSFIVQIRSQDCSPTKGLEGEMEHWPSALMAKKPFAISV